jgi:arylsulfatase A-like enzyme
MQRRNIMHRIRRMLKALPVGLSALAFVLTGAAAQAQEKKPNIVVIMTDDVGWGDLGSYGGGVMRGAPTPHLDRLAAEGMRFVNYYGQASCTAGRASFITGRIPIRTALSLVLVPGDPNYLHKEDPTIAEQMKKAGYTTVQLGKWHLGDVPEAYPIAHGFDPGPRAVRATGDEHGDQYQRRLRDTEFRATRRVALPRRGSACLRGSGRFQPGWEARPRRGELWLQQRDDPAR